MIIEAVQLHVTPYASGYESSYLRVLYIIANDVSPWFSFRECLTRVVSVQVTARVGT